MEKDQPPVLSRRRRVVEASSRRRRSVVGALSSSERVQRTYRVGARTVYKSASVQRFYGYLDMNASRPNRNTRGRRASRSDFLPLPSLRFVSLRHVPTVHVFSCVIFSALLMTSMSMNSHCRIVVVIGASTVHIQSVRSDRVQERVSPRIPWLSPHEFICIAPKSE